MKLSLSLTLLCGLLFSGLAEAETSGVDPRIAEARTACVAGDYQKGVRLLADLYTASDDPIWIFNQGRCYQQNAQPELALSRFREFLRKSGGGPDDQDIREEAEKYIAEIQAERPPSKTGTGEGKDQLPSPSLGEGGRATPPGVAATTESVPRRGWWLGRKWTWVAAGSTVLLTAVATGVGMSANGLYDDLQKSCGSKSEDYVSRGCTESDVGPLRTRKNIANVFWALSGAAAATTAVLFFVEGHRLAVAPMAGETTGVMALVEF